MITPDKQRRSLMLRLKIAVFSLAAFLISAACSPRPPRDTRTPVCYEPVIPTGTPEPIVTCYAATAPSPTFTPSPTTFTSPISPIPTPEARYLLRERLLAEGRFPRDVARALES